MTQFVGFAIKPQLRGIEFLIVSIGLASNLAVSADRASDGANEKHSDCGH
jgi:hypothetical protein